MTAVFALGSNGSGQLGIGHREDVSVPKQVLFHPEPPTSPVTRIGAGGNHTLLVTRSGELFWSGDASSGACGRVVSGQAPPPAQFHKLDQGPALSFRVGLVTATWEASIITEQDDHGRNVRVYSFGTGQKGELGQGELIIRTPVPAVIADFPPPGTEIIDLAACMGHAVAVLSNGDAYGWGNGRKGQLGMPETVVQKPRKLGGVGFKISRAVCGREFTCLLGDPERGELAVLGSDKWGVKTSAPASLVGWKDVGASWSNVFVLKRDGSVESWGRNDHGQMVPPNLPAVSQIAIGSEHALSLTNDGDVLAWGWGEHGNCGPQVEGGDVKGRWNLIASSRYVPPGSKIVSIGGGCATSWISIHSPS